MYCCSIDSVCLNAIHFTGLLSVDQAANLSRGSLPVCRCWQITPAYMYALQLQKCCIILCKKNVRQEGIVCECEGCPVIYSSTCAVYIRMLTWAGGEFHPHYRDIALSMYYPVQYIFPLWNGKLSDCFYLCHWYYLKKLPKTKLYILLVSRSSIDQGKVFCGLCDIISYLKYVNFSTIYNMHLSFYTVLCINIFSA